MHHNSVFFGFLGTVIYASEYVNKRKDAVASLATCYELGVGFGLFTTAWMVKFVCACD